MESIREENCRVLPLLLLSVSLLLLCSTAIDTVTPSQPIKDGQTLVSAGGKFALGFFSPNNSSNRYVGIWYNNLPMHKIIWVANRANPLNNSLGVLKINRDGNLVISDGRGRAVWSTNASISDKNNTSAEIMDSGNIFLREGGPNNGRIAWQSFDHPSNSILPAMKLTTDPKTKERKQLSSWKSDSDPSIGDFCVGIDTPTIPQIVIWNGSVPYWRSGPWNTRTFVGIPAMVSMYLRGLQLIRDDQGSVELFALVDDAIWMAALDSSGKLQEFSWDEEKKDWVITWLAPKDECEVYGTCGAFGSCSMLGQPICRCLRGFQPKSAEEWSKGNWSGGCVRRSQLQCQNSSTEGGEGDRFLKLEKMKVPDSPDWMRSSDVKECEGECLKKCSCVAYAYDSAIGCMFWRGDLKDIQEFSSGGMDLYIRLAESELNKQSNIKIVIIIIVITGVIICGVLMYICWRKLSNRKEDRRKQQELLLILHQGLGMEAPENSLNVNTISDISKNAKGPELPIFSFHFVAASTNNFSNENKIGQGGFGSVYKGILPEGQEIAVKRLLKGSGQGLEEFKNEVVLISKLQHRNLVRLLGCCIERDEKLLVYEHMSNKSLDAFLFDPTKKGLLDWRKRFHVIEGIAWGLLYLHRDSRFKIIHRDLKPSNILLDGEMNPKISDFGMARIFRGNQIHGETKRVVGTYGYMSPEYAMGGKFSEKSDVFSFGVLLLEIVSGKRNTSFYFREEFVNLLNYAWKLWNQHEVLELIDPELHSPFSQAEVLRCIHVGLLCVQEFPKDRPSMSSVVSMLDNDSAILPTPKKPAFTESSTSEQDLPQRGHEIHTTNDLTISITMFHGR